jgi:hypothetical protein
MIILRADKLQIAEFLKIADLFLQLGPEYIISGLLPNNLNRCIKFYVWFSVHHKLIYVKNQRDATWQYVY